MCRFFFSFFLLLFSEYLLFCHTTYIDGSCTNHCAVWRLCKKTPDQRSSAPKHNEHMHKPFIKSVFSSINRMPFLLFMELIYWRSDLCEVCRITHIQFCSKRWHYWSKGRNCKPLQMHVCDELWLHKLKPLWFWWFFFSMINVRLHWRRNSIFTIRNKYSQFLKETNLSCRLVPKGLRFISAYWNLAVRFFFVFVVPRALITFVRKLRISFDQYENN